MHLRYPEGIRSVVDADLSRARQLPGADARRHGDGQERRLDPADRRAGNIFDFGRARRQPAAAAPPRRRPAGPAAVRRPDPRAVDAAASTTISLRLVASADLTLRGTYDRPVLFGRAEIGRGEVTFEGSAIASRAARSISRNPTASSRSSTSRPKPTSACRAADVSRHGRRRRHDGAARMPTLELRPAAADGRRPGAAAERRRSGTTCRELRELRGSTQQQTDICSARAAQALDQPDLDGSRQASCSRPSASTRFSCRRPFDRPDATRRASTRRRA